MNRLTFSTIVIILSTFFILGNVAPTKADELIVTPMERSSTRASNILFKCNWGVGDKDIGLISHPESDSIGPSTFALGPDGCIYIMDAANQCLKKFDRDGNFVEILCKGLVASSFCVNKKNQIFARTSSAVVQFSSSGVQLSSAAISDSIPAILGYGQHIHVNANDEVSINAVNKHYKIAAVAGEKLSAFADRKQTDSVKRGMRKSVAGSDKGNDPLFSTQWVNDHTANLIIQTETSTNRVPFSTEDKFGAVLVDGIDKDGNVYVETERITADDYVHLDMIVFSAEGVQLRNFEVPNLYYTTVNKKLEISPSGVVFQMLTTADGLQILKWER